MSSGTSGTRGTRGTVDPVAPGQAPGAELDEVRTVVGTGTWMALLTVGLLLAAAVTWAFAGSVGTQVAGKGILIRSGTLFPVVAISSGQLLALEVKEGQAVQKGAVVARLDQPTLRAELREAESLLLKLNEERRLLELYEKKNDALTERHLEKQRRALRESIRLGGIFIVETEAVVASLEALHRQGLVSTWDLEKRPTDLRRAQLQVLQDEQSLAGLDVLAQKTVYEVDQRLVEVTKQIVPVEERVVSLRERLKSSSEVHSLYSGVVVELHRNPGTMLQQGDSIGTLEMTASGEPGADDEPVVVAYVAPFQGLELRAGMQAQVIPESVRDEEYGAMLGEVLAISPYPASPKGVMRVLDNSDLVRTLTRDGAPVMVRIGLKKDAGTPSGYRWSSGKGPPTTVKSGAQCVVRIIARRRAPIELIVPELRRRFLGAGVPLPPAGR